MRYVVDTHALVWYLTNDTRLGVGARQVLDDPSALLVIPTIVLVEAKHISERKPIPISFDDIMQTIAADARITIFSLDIFVVAGMPKELDIHDGLIVATAFSAQKLFEEEIVILTRDEVIAASNQLPVIW